MVSRKASHDCASVSVDNTPFPVGGIIESFNSSEVRANHWDAKAIKRKKM